MSSAENSHGRGMEGDPPEQQLRRLRSNIEEQCRQVAMAVDLITAALSSGGTVTSEMMSHIKAQILKAHLQLEDLEQALNSIH
jgi:hypothetical protein